MQNTILIVLVLFVLLIGRFAFTVARKKHDSQDVLGDGEADPEDEILPKVEFVKSDDRWKQQYFLRMKSVLETQASDQAFTSKKLIIDQLLVALGHKSNEVIGKELEVQDMFLKLKAETNEFSKKQALLEIDGEKAKLVWQSLENKKEEIVITQQLHNVEAGKKEIELGLREIKMRKLENEFALEKLVQDLKNLQQQIILSEKSNDLRALEAMLNLRKEKLNLVADYQKYNYDLQLKALNVFEHEKNLDLREKKLELQGLYQKTTMAIDKLRYVSPEESLREQFQRRETYFQEFLSWHLEFLRFR